MKRYILPLLAGLAMFMAAGLWNLVIVEKLQLVTIPKEMLREVPIFPLVLIGYVALAALIVYVGTHSRFTSSTTFHWIVAGICIMEAAFGISGAVLQAFYRFPLSALPLDLLWYVGEGALGGFIISQFKSLRPLGSASS